MIVMKFGGTSNQDASAMGNVIRIVKSHLSEQPIVVISAIAQATNELERTARTAALGKRDDASSIVTRLFERHNQIIDNLIRSPGRSTELESAFFDYLTELKLLIHGVAILGELTARTMDAICSYGERLSSRIIAAALHEHDVDAVWVDARDFMITDDNFGAAEPIMEIVQEKLAKVIRPLLEKGKTPVTQGFIGTTQSGISTTMGRESSDYSASIIGAAMGAKKVQIWTDVDGILTADPALVKSTKKLKTLSFEEAFELSYFGAKVLHPNTMLPVLERKIPVQILNSKRQAGSGTLVDVDAGTQNDATMIKSIAFKRGLSLIMIIPRKRFSQYLFWEGIYSVLNRHGITTAISATSEYSIALAVESKRIGETLVHELEEFGSVKHFPNKGSICLVGKGIRESSGLVSRIFNSLSQMNIMMVSFGASDMSLTLALDEDQLAPAMNRLHREFFEKVEAGSVFETLPQE